MPDFNVEQFKFLFASRTFGKLKKMYANVVDSNAHTYI